MSRGPGVVQVGVLEYLRTQPAEHTEHRMVSVYPTRYEPGETRPWPSFVAIDKIAAEVIGTPVTRAGLESVRRVVKRLAAGGEAELGWWYERVPVGDSWTYTSNYDGQEHTRQMEGERRKLAARRLLTEAEAAAEAAYRAEQQAQSDERLAHLVATLGRG